MVQVSGVGATSKTAQVSTTKQTTANDKPQAKFEKSAWNMARKFNMTVEEFKKLNPQIKNWNSVKTGEPVNVPVVGLETTVYSLAKKYNMSTEELLVLNPQITDTRNLKKGTWLMVPKKPFGEVKEATHPTKSDSAKVSKSNQDSNLPTDTRQVKLGNGETYTVSGLQEKANEVAKNEKRPVSRPKPVVDGNGKIVANVKIYNAKQNAGELKGKTIIVNAGHGGYRPDNGFFDPGTHAEDKNKKIIEEWYKNTNFTDQLIDKLTSKGAKVVFVNGHVLSVQDAKSKYKDADMFISIHCDSAGDNSKKRGQTVYYYANTSKRLATSLEKSIETHNWIDPNLCKSAYGNFGVLKVESDIPSVLIEVGFQSNEKDLANIDSHKYQVDFANLVTQGVINYYRK